MATITATIRAIENPHTNLISSDVANLGTISSVDSDHTCSVYAFIIDQTIQRTRDTTFIQDQLIDGQLSLSLYDSTYIDGTKIDSTYMDGTYQVRTFNPIWTNYSIWYLDPPEGIESVLQGYRFRTPINPNVGQFYANMIAPDPGRYKIQWLYKKNQSSFVMAIDEPFSVSSRGVDSEPDYT